jgi:hypothetical protein
MPSIRQAGERRVRAGEAVRRLVDGAIAAERHHHVVALAGGVAAELGRVVSGLGVDRFDVIAAAQCVHHEVLEPVRDGRGVRVDDHQHALARRFAADREHRLQAFERIRRRSGHAE